MDIDLRLPSADLDKEDEEPTAMVILNGEDKLHIREGIPLINTIESHDLRVAEHSGAQDFAEYKDDTNLEPLFGMEFTSHQEAYTFYQEYARSMGFNTAIQNSRRSKTSREFIDAKFACSRYGTKREYDKATASRPRARQITKQEPDSATGRRACGKTDCKASMHVKRRPDGKWIIHSFIKEHNHDLLPAQAVSEQTRRIYAAMAKQFAEYKSVAGLKNDPKNGFDNKGRSMALEAGEIKCLLDFCVHMQSLNSNFFYAVDVSDDLHVKNLLWVDAKSRHDYVNFNDVVSFDTTYVRNKYKMPLALFIGVNQHYQFLLLGCAFVSDESEATYSWIMHTWSKAMGGQTPKVIITDQDSSMSLIVSRIFPTAQHSFFLWHVLAKVYENLAHVIKEHENFTKKFEKCIYRSWTDEEFERRWQKLIGGFDLKENEWFRLLYEDRKLWAPTYMKDTFLGGMSTVQRSESVNSVFDKCVHRKTSVSEFVKQYEPFMQDRYEEEAKAENDTWNKQPMLKSPSPLEKHMSGLYTHAVFKRFQVEVLGAVACHPKEERQEDLMESIRTFRVQDLEKIQDFVVCWNEMKSEIFCICRLFEYRGYLCRHALIVLQMCGLAMIPPQYVLNRWKKEAKERQMGEIISESIGSRVQRYNELCRRAMKLGEEGCLSQESFSFVVRAMEEAFVTCLSLNNTSGKAIVELGGSTSHGVLSIEDDTQSRSLSKTVKKKCVTKKRKVNTEAEIMTVVPQDNLQQIEKLNSRSVPSLDGFYGSQQNVPGMVQLNLMAPTRDNYYGSQPTIPGLGLNSMAPTHDSYYGTQPMHSLVPGQMDFFRSSSFTYGIRDEPNVRSAQLHDDGQRHP